MRLDPWPFVIAAYALTLVLTLAQTLWSYAAMRRAEAEADGLNERQ